MSSQKSKQKKPFLKRGSRQFLSNAQVRSQSSKPKIVDFGAADEQFVAPLKTRSSQNVDPNCDDIQIKVAPSSSKAIPIPKSKDQPPKPLERPPTNQAQRPSDHSAGKPRRQTSIGKKKQAVLSDYLDNDSNIPEDPYQKKISVPKPESLKKYQQKKPIEKKTSMERQNIKHTYLVQQEQQDEDEPNFMANDSFKPLANPLKNRQPPTAQKNNYGNKGAIGRQENKRKNSDSDQQQKREQVNFVSDNSEEQQNIPRFNIAKNTNKVKFNNQKQDDVEQQQQGVSKIKMNYFNNRNSDKSKTSITPQQTQQREKSIPTRKALTTNQIPKQVKQQIVKEALAEKEQELHQQLQKLREKFTVLKREKQKVEQDQKALMKTRHDFEKEMQQKNREFEQKLKNQNSKLAREKKYMKDAQMAGQGDRKVKVQIEELRKLLEKERQDKKKFESKYKLEVQSLRKKLGEQMQKNKLLTQQIKLLEYGKVIHEEQLQQMVKQQKKNSVQAHKAGLWVDAPQDSFLSRFLEEGFSLIQMDSSRFHYEKNQYYQYYLKVKDNHSPLQFESADQQRAKRQYKNGKVEVEQFQKYLKQIFPFNYTVVTLWNGDIKQTLPDGTLVYYSYNSGATQYCLKNKDVQKQIVYFPSSETVQMKVTKKSNSSGDFHQVYCSGHLKRTLSDGTVILEKKDNRGKIISMTGNM